MRLPCSTVLLFVFALSPRPSVAQQSEPPRKSETTATILGLILPGAGHIYAGETGRGLLVMGTSGLAFAYGFSDGQCKRPYTDVRTCELDKNETLAGISLAAALGIYAFSAWDAHRAVKRTNARRGRVVGYFNVSSGLAVSSVPRPTTRLRVELSRVR
ncbi:MAG TPA: DUF6677 family protein [Gemmatimonadaceae bacterium]|nr:DUF6677 family protein [Gemmatimonadaceae bacterium]